VFELYWDKTQHDKQGYFAILKRTESKQNWDGFGQISRFDARLPISFDHGEAEENFLGSEC